MQSTPTTVGTAPARAGRSNYSTICDVRIMTGNVREFWSKFRNRNWTTEGALIVNGQYCRKCLKFFTKKVEVVSY